MHHQMFIWNPRASRSHHFKPALMSTSTTNVPSSQALGIILTFLFKLKKISITFHVKGFVIGHWNADETLTFLISFSTILCNARDSKFFSSQALHVALGLKFGHSTLTCPSVLTIQSPYGPILPNAGFTRFSPGSLRPLDFSMWQSTASNM